jgi:hypothetical protein
MSFLHVLGWGTPGIFGRSWECVGYPRVSQVVSRFIEIYQGIHGYLQSSWALAISRDILVILGNWLWHKVDIAGSDTKTSLKHDDIDFEPGPILTRDIRPGLNPPTISTLKRHSTDSRDFPGYSGRNRQQIPGYPGNPREWALAQSRL